MNDPWPSRVVENPSVTLTVAVAVEDAVTGRRLRDVDVSLADRDDEPVRNPSGYHCFVDLPSSVDSVTVEVDGGSRYRDVATVIDLDTLDPDAPSERIPLQPAPSFQFPPGETVLRGRVEEGTGPPGTGTPLADVPVHLVDGERSTTTTDAGEFVFVFDSTTDVTGGVVQVDGGSPTVEADPPTRGARSTTVHLLEGESDFVVFQYAPDD